MQTAVLESGKQTDRRPIATWQIFTLVALGNVLLAWVLNAYVVTEEVYGNILGEQLEIARIGDFLDVTRRYQVWGYAISPIVLGFRLALVALLVQLALLLTGVDVRFSELFRVATWASIPQLYATALRTGWLAMLEPSRIGLRELGLVPGAISNLMDPASYNSGLYQLMSFVSVFALLWLAVMVLGVKKASGLSAGAATVVVGGVWATITLFQWALVLYLTGVNA